MTWIHPSARNKPTGLGLQEGRLAPCPDSPNCVSSQASSKSHLVEAISYQVDRDNARKALIAILENESKATIITQTDEYIHVEFRAFIFIDDVEFYFPKEEAIIHVRSASRVGRSDLGANKRRVKSITSAFSSRE